MINYRQIMACQTFNPDMDFGYSNINITISALGKITS